MSKPILPTTTCLVLPSDDRGPDDDEYRVMVIHHRFDQPASDLPLCRIDTVGGMVTLGADFGDDWGKICESSADNPNALIRGGNLFFVVENGMAVRLRTHGGMFPDAIVAFGKMAQHSDANRAGLNHPFFDNGALDWGFGRNADGMPFVLTRKAAADYPKFATLVRKFVESVAMYQDKSGWAMQQLAAGTPFRSFIMHKTARAGPAPAA